MKTILSILVGATSLIACASGGGNVTDDIRAEWNSMSSEAQDIACSVYEDGGLTASDDAGRAKLLVMSEECG